MFEVALRILFIFGISILGLFLVTVIICALYESYENRKKRKLTIDNVKGRRKEYRRSEDGNYFYPYDTSDGGDGGGGGGGDDGGGGGGDGGGGADGGV